MLVNMYAIYDSKAAAYLQPFFCANHLLALRNLERACKNPQSPFAEFPADFTLFQLATFEDVTGVVTPFRVAESLGTLLQCMPLPTPQTSPTAAAAA